MATLDYTKRLNNLRTRKFDLNLNESVLSKSFSLEGIPQNIKYLVESMRPIGTKYNEKTLEAAENVRTHLERGFNLHFNRAYRTQGSVRTSTNIRVHSDFDLLTIIDRYYYPERYTPGNEYTASNPVTDIQELRSQAIEILKSKYDEVDDSSEKCVTILNQSLNRTVDVVFCYWYNTIQYEEKKDEYFRGVKLPSTPPKIDYPFATIHLVNAKGDSTIDGSRCGIRLLKNLKADSDDNIQLSSFQLTTIVHSISDHELGYARGGEIKIATSVSSELARLINNPAHRISVKSPNGIEFPLIGDNVVPELRKIKNDLDTLIEDSIKELSGSDILKKAVVNY